MNTSHGAWGQRGSNPWTMNVPKNSCPPYHLRYRTLVWLPYFYLLDIEMLKSVVTSEFYFYILILVVSRKKNVRCLTFSPVSRTMTWLTDHLTTQFEYRTSTPFRSLLSLIANVAILINIAEGTLLLVTLKVLVPSQPHPLNKMSKHFNCDLQNSSFCSVS